MDQANENGPAKGGHVEDDLDGDNQRDDDNQLDDDKKGAPSDDVKPMRPPSPLTQRPQEGPPWIAADEIKAMRQYLRLTQRQFAGWFGFPAATLRHWELGNRHPNGAALVLLTVIRDNPRVVIQAVRKARQLAPGSLPDIEPLKSYRAPPGFGERRPPLRKRGPRHKR